MKAKILCVFVGILIALWANSVLAQSESQAISLAKEAKAILEGIGLEPLMDTEVAVARAVAASRAEGARSGTGGAL